jgi:hypothetical protein
MSDNQGERVRRMTNKREAGGGRHGWRCNFTSVVELDALVRLLSEFVADTECYCSDYPKRTCPVHEAEELLKLNDSIPAMTQDREPGGRDTNG